MLTLEWGEGNKLNNFSFNNCTASYNGDFISVRVPYGMDLTKVVPTFSCSANAKVFVNDELQISGVSSVNLSMPVEYSVVGKQGEINKYIVSVNYGDIPCVFVNTDGLVDITSREEYLSNTTVYVTNSDYNSVYSKANIKGRGNSSWGMPKKSYTVKLDKKAEFCGFAKHKTFALVANYADKTLFRNAFAYKMGRNLFNNMAWTPSTKFAHYVLNGKYMGVYMLSETVKIDQNRVNIPNIEDCKDVASANQYGFIVEVNSRMDEYFNFKTKHEVKFSQKEPDGEDISTDIQEFIKNTIQNVENSIFSKNYDTSSSEHYSKYLDLPSFIDWYLVNEITKNNDAVFYSSCYMYFDPSDHKVHMGPLWDFDISCGNINYNNNYLTDRFWVKNATWIKELFKDPYFINLLKKRWNNKISSLRNFVSTNMYSYSQQLDEEADVNFSRWNILGKYVWPNADGYANRNTYESEVAYMQNWLNERIDWLDAAINEL